MPCYLKNHSQGEYVFDYGWADAIHRAGGRYYPKLQVSIPFTPASGPRVLTAARENSSAVRAAMGNAAQQLCDKLGASSVHMTFLKQDEYDDFGAQGWLQRNDTQFHWHNDGFSSFDQFLGALSSRKRKNIRKERERAALMRGEILPLHRGPDHGGALGPLLPFLYRHGRAQMGHAISHPRVLLLSSRRNVGRRHPAGDGRNAKASCCGRA
jgi:predicted N-acyltransferase